MIRPPMRRILCGGMLVLYLAGCGVASPVLVPDLLTGETDGSLEQLKVSIRPVVTTGFRSEDKKQFGLDLSAYFTAFYVQIQNDLPREVQVDASKIYLQYDDHPPVQAMDESQSVVYYRQGDRPSQVLVLVPKSRKLEKEEIAKIRKLHFKSAVLPPGGQHQGVVYFKKIQDKQCQRVLFSLREVQIEGEELPQEFEFSFSCSG